MEKRGEIRFGLVTAWAEEDWHSRRLLAACSRHGVAITVDPAELAARVGDDGFSLRAGRVEISAFDAVLLVRGLGRTGDADLQFECYRALEESGTLVVNRIDALLGAQDKLRTSWLLSRVGVPTPPCAVAQTRRAALDALSWIGRAVLKPVAGSLGEGVELVSADRAGRKRVVERLERDGAAYLQGWIPNPGRDLRLFVVGRNVAGAIERVAQDGAIVANVSRGAQVRPVRRDPQIEEMAVAASRALGLDWAGVDVVRGPRGPQVIEVNGNPSWQGILEATGEDMAEPIARHVLARALRRSGKSKAVLEDARATHG
ncbi:MAG TPA: RimK family alpha-L-glutamate ligase [Anaeromyxobacteraceae bacterium]|nr:RimK family alpha-L-glutamate ligase [Anaeromyxobacteraceae bacterium]